MEFSSFLGKTCTVLSKQNVRYSGTLVNIDSAAQKIQVTHVKSYGTENRPAPVFIPPLDQEFALIEFHVNDLQDLKFEESVAPVTNVSQPAPPSAQAPAPVPVTTGYSAEKAVPASGGFSAEKAVPAGYKATQVKQQTQPTTVDGLQQSLGNMKISNGTPSPAPTRPRYDSPRGDGRRRGGPGRGRGGYGQYNQSAIVDIKIPASDFDFQANNKRFDKVASPATTTEPKEDGEITPATEENEKFYNPSKSFFDNISSEATTKKAPGAPRGTSGGGNRGGRGRGGRGREERDRNVETFGEPGGGHHHGVGMFHSGYRGKRRGRGRGNSNGVRVAVHDG